MFIVVVVMSQNCQVMLTFLDCCWYNGGVPQSPDYWSSCNGWGEMGVEEWRMIVVSLLKINVRLACEI